MLDVGCGVGSILDVVDIVKVEEAEGWRGGAVGGVDCGGESHGVSCGQVCAKILLVFGGHPLFALVRLAVKCFPLLYAVVSFYGNQWISC